MRRSTSSKRTLADNGAILLKFWLHISRQEQLRRFVELAGDPAAAWQVTAEDWEDHRRYDDYVAAVRDMLANTDTPFAPWIPVDATNREYRMYSVCRTLIERLEDALGTDRSQWPTPQALEALECQPGGGQTSQGVQERQASLRRNTSTNGQSDDPLEAKGQPKGGRRTRRIRRIRRTKETRRKRRTSTPTSQSAEIAAAETDEHAALPENGQGWCQRRDAGRGHPEIGSRA